MPLISPLTVAIQESSTATYVHTECTSKPPNYIVYIQSALPSQYPADTGFKFLSSQSAAACTESVADAAIWLILSCFRQFTWSALAARSLSTAQFTDVTRNVAAVTHNPAGHSLGIIGLGKIGQRLAQKASLAFDMQIMYHDIRRATPDREAELKATFFPTLDSLLGAADCIVLATPFAGETLMTAARFAQMKAGSFFVNIARGKLVDEDALVAALESRHIAAAALDVHFNEPVVHSRLAAMRNVELLCHMAGASEESHVGFERMGMQNILDFFETGNAISPVNLEWLPPKPT